MLALHFDSRLFHLSMSFPVPYTTAVLYFTFSLFPHIPLSLPHQDLPAEHGQLLAGLW